MSSLRVNRRFLLATALGSTAVVVGGAALMLRNHAPTLEQPSASSEYPMGKLAGRNIGSLYAIYIGYEGKIPSRLKINWPQRMEYMWTAKVTNSHNNRVVRQTRDKLLPEFAHGEPKRMSLAAYLKVADGQADLLHKKLDWDKVGSMYFTRQGKVNKRKQRLLKNVAGQVRGNELIAYALTELMPGQNDGAFNRDFLDFLLRQGGREFVERIPALYDDRTSFGTYQFTSFALYDVPGERRGASNVNQALPPMYRIPGSVMLLRENDHFKAAYLFAVHNLAVAIARLDDKQVHTFERNRRQKVDSIVEFIAVAHHGPAAAYNACGRWLDNKAKQPFRNSCSGRYRTYANKTANNYKALA